MKNISMWFHSILVSDLLRQTVLLAPGQDIFYPRQAEPGTMGRLRAQSRAERLGKSWRLSLVSDWRKTTQSPHARCQEFQQTASWREGRKKSLGKWLLSAVGAPQWTPPQSFLLVARRSPVNGWHLLCAESKGPWGEQDTHWALGKLQVWKPPCRSGYPWGQLTWTEHTCPQQSKARRCVGGRPLRKEIPAEGTAGESRDAAGTWHGKKQEDQRWSPGPGHLSIGPKENGLSKRQEIVKVRRAWHAAVHSISKSWIWHSDWTITKRMEPIMCPYTSSPTRLIHNMSSTVHNSKDMEAT